jgi:hypothetical protein
MAEVVAGPPRWFDSFSNFLAGFGLFGRDKSVSQQYYLNLLSPQQLEAAYRGDWLARKIVEVPAFDCTRAWRSWVAEQDQIEQLERTEQEFGLQHKLLSALTKARLYGGSALIIGVDQGDWGEELDVDRVGKGDLKFVHVVDRWHLAAGPLVRDISNSYFGLPQWYMRANVPLPPQIGNVEQLEAAMKGLPPGSAVYIHPSRVVRLIGCDYPAVEFAPDPWGDSVLQVVDTAVKNAGLVASSVSAAIGELKFDIIKIKGLSAMMETTEGAKKLVDRFSNANAAKSVVNSVMLDKEEEWERRELRLTNMDRVLMSYLTIACGAADIPATRLLGRSPEGLDATGDSDTRNYYDRLAADQTVRLTPAMARLDDILIRHTFGSRDPDIHYHWDSLWQMDDKEKADINLKVAQAHNFDVQAGLMSPAVLKKARENFLIENPFMYPGIEAAIEDFDDGELGEMVHEAAVAGLQREIEPPMPGEPGGPPLPAGPPRPGGGGGNGSR